MLRLFGCRFMKRFYKRKAVNQLWLTACSYATVLAVMVSLLLSASTAFCQMMINVNQVGYLPDEAKIAVIASQEPLDSATFHLLASDGKVDFTGTLSADLGEYLAFKHHYLANFHRFKDIGKYRVAVGLLESQTFEIGNSLYGGIPDSLMRFFKVQRCGSNDALLHAECHLYDVRKVVSKNGTSDAPLDLTGGWHDAGDYVKFSVTTAYSSYLLLLTAELFPKSKPQLEAEARIGLEWLLKMHPTPDRLITQVEGVADHKVGWRMPEADPLAKKRTAYEFPSQAQAGIVSAALAFGARAYREGDANELAGRFLRASEELYAFALSGRLSAAASPPDSHYFDAEARDDLALAAAELYATTQRVEYLDSAKAILSVIGAGGWVSWGDVEGFACYRAGQFWPASVEMLQASLQRYEQIADNNPYGYPASSFPWGSLALQTGVANLAVLYAKMTGDRQFDTLAIRQRDFLLGTNPYGVSLVSELGSVHVRHFHHQIAAIKRIPLPGGVAGGLVSRKTFTTSGIRLEAPDRFASIQSTTTVFHDDRMDFLTNEPTISGVAQAILLLAWCENAGMGH